MHRNTFLHSPKLLTKSLQFAGKANDAGSAAEFSVVSEDDNIFFAGQITGVEGYCESSMTGIVAGLSLARKLQRKPPLNFPNTSMTGALTAYVSGELPVSDFQPMGANMGILPPLPVTKKIKKDEKYALLADRGISDLIKLKNSMQI
jgi:methylenetetrahydrofolate--tRNA-(uracil-5-)-methyltransferase